MPWRMFEKTTFDLEQLGSMSWSGGIENERKKKGDWRFLLFLENNLRTGGKDLDFIPCCWLAKDA